MASTTDGPSHAADAPREAGRPGATKETSTVPAGLVACLIAVLAAIALATATTSSARAPTCFGAPAMDPAFPCVSRLVTITPHVSATDDEPASPCDAVKSTPALNVCAFGVSKSKARLRIALIGDSHTVAWRAVLNQLGTTQDWRGYSLAAPGCMFSQAARYLPVGPRAPCLRTYHATLSWLHQHPEINAVITTHEADTELTVAKNETRNVKIAGFRRTWKALPHNIKRIIVIRDTPNASRKELACVQHAAATSTTAGVCAVPRSWTLTRDAAVAAARGLHSPRYRVLDLTDLICSSTVCHPAVGGVLINRDTTGHITETFAETTAPYLLHRLTPLLPTTNPPNQ